VAQLHRLQEQFGDRLVVISVHSAKFTAEKLTENIRQAAARHGIEHPVVNDAGFAIWQTYGVQAWPTVVLIDPAGNYVGSQPGELMADEFAPLIQRLLDEFGEQGLLADAPLGLTQAAPQSTGPLRHATRLLVDAQRRLIVSDTGHQRIQIYQPAADRRSATLVQSIDAALDHPHGIAVWQQTLYVADTENHAIKAIDLESGAVRLIAGTGEKALRPSQGGPATQTALRSPWAIVATGPDQLLIAMAGSHQIWRLDGDQLSVFAGNGREALVDGAASSASFNQPSDLVLQDGLLYVADAEASAIRAVELTGQRSVRTIVGQGLFEWGDIDGVGPEVRLQHPIGLTGEGSNLLVADSYNHKIKRLDPVSGRTESLIGSGEPGAIDGPFETATFFEPHGLFHCDGKLLIADTNNHAIRIADLATRQVWTLELSC